MMRWSKIIFPWRAMKTTGRAGPTGAGLCPRIAVLCSSRARGHRGYWWSRLRAGPSAGAQASASTHRAQSASFQLFCTDPAQCHSLLAALKHKLPSPAASHSLSSLGLKRFWSYCPAFQGSHTPSPAPCISSPKPGHRISGVGLTQQWAPAAQKANHILGCVPGTGQGRWFSTSDLLSWDPPGALHPGLSPPVWEGREAVGMSPEEGTQD